MADALCPLCNGELGSFHGRLPWLARCRRCALVLQPERSEDPIALAQEHYGEETLEHRARIRPILERVARERWRWLDSALGSPAPGRLLEIGCATGEFLAAARSAGWEVAGIEASAVFRAGAAAWHGLELRSELFRAGAFPRESLDGLVLLHVFEHLPDPLAFLADAHDVLAPGGWLFLIVPNLESASDRPYGAAALHLAKRDHLFHYTCRSLARLVASGGFEAQRVETVEPRHHLWTGLYGWLSARRPPARSGAGGATNGRLRRWRSRLPYLVGDLLAPATWPYRAWIARRGGGHEIQALFRKPGDARAAEPTREPERAAPGAGG